jgi:hypothetical protein
MTIVISAFMFDLGGTAYLQSAGYGVFVGRRLYVQAAALAILGVVIVTGIALVVSTWLGSSLRITTDSQTFVALIATTGAAAAFRSTFSVMMTRLQVAEEFELRTRMLVAQAIIQMLMCWIALAVGAGLWSLPISLVGSVVPLLLWTHRRLGHRRAGLPEARPPGYLPSFASVRTLSAIMALVSSQADRWVLATLAPATFLTNYDLALRLAALPIGLVITMFGGLIAEAAEAKGTEDRRALVRSATVRVGAIVGTLSAIGFAAVVAAGSFGLQMVNPQMTLILALGLTWLGINSLTVPTTMTFIGVGRPANEFRYTVPVVICSALGWWAATITGNPWVIPWATLASVSIWSLWFVHYGTTRARY